MNGLNCRRPAFVPNIVALVLAGMLAGPTALAATGVTVTAERREVAPGDTVTLEIVMEGDFDDVRVPEMPDFQIVGRSSGSSISIVNGRVSRQQRLTLAVSPTREGELKIGKVDLLKNGKVIASSNELSIRASQNAAPGQSRGARRSPLGSLIPAPSPDPATPDGADEEEDNMPDALKDPDEPVQQGLIIPAKFRNKKVFLLSRIPDRPMYAGEPVFLEYVLYTRSDVPLAGLQLKSAPTLKGFIVENQTKDSDSATAVVIGNQRFEERVLWRSAVTAIDPGPAVIDSMAVDLLVGDLFGRRKFPLSSDPRNVEFKEIPTEGRPADFIPGTIGTFIVNTTVDKPIVKVGESAVLTVEIAGSGNLRALKPPRMEELDGLRIDRVASSDLDETRVDRGGISGRKVFQFLLTPDREGTFDLGRVEVPFFNNLTGAFERARSEKIVINAAGFSAGGRILEAKRDVPEMGIIGESDLSAPSDPKSTGIGALSLAAIMAAPALLFGAVETSWRRRLHLRSNAAEIAGRKALKLALAELRRIERSEAGGLEFFERIDSLLRQYLSARFALNTIAMTPSELAVALSAAGVSPEAARLVIDELEACAFARFAPPQSMTDDRAAAPDRVRRCLLDLDDAAGGVRA